MRHSQRVCLPNLNTKTLPHLRVEMLHVGNHPSLGPPHVNDGLCRQHPHALRPVCSLLQHLVGGTVFALRAHLPVLLAPQLLARLLLLLLVSWSLMLFLMSDERR